MNKNYYGDNYIQRVKEYYQDYISQNGSDKNFDFMECVETVDSIVGYYVVEYGDDALKTWRYNLELATNKHSTDKEVTRILTKLYI